MLIWMRSGVGAGVIKYFLLGMLLMAVAGLVLMDVGGFFRGTMGSDTIVKGGGLNIGAVEFDRTVRRALASQGVQPQEAYQLGLINNVLQSEIQNRLFTMEARKLGLEVGDEAVKTQISKLAEPLANEGRSKKEALQQILRSQGISEGEFVAAIRQELANGLLRAAISAPDTLSSPLLAQNLYRYDNEKRTVQVIYLKNSDVKDLTPPTEEQLRKYYDANKSMFLIPETRTITLATLQPEMLKKNIRISDEDLKAEYEKNIATFTRADRRVAEQAVLSDEAAAKAVVDAVKSGKSLKDAAKSGYMGEQDFEEAGLLPEIGGPVFAAEKGAVIGPISTSLGWHVLVLKDILPESVTPFDKVKDSLRSEMENIRLTEEMFQVGNTIEDRIAGGDKLSDLVKEYGMTTEVIGPFRQNGKDADGKDLFKSFEADRDKLIQAAYDYEEGEVPPVIETADGEFHLIQIDKVVPDIYKDYESVKAQLETRWLDEQRTLANKGKAKDMLDALNAGTSLDQVAKDNGVSVSTINGINRKDAPPAPLTPIVAAQVFATENGKPFSSETDSGFIVGQVTDVILPAPAAANDKQLEEMKEVVGKSLGSDILGQYVVELTEGKKIKVNQARLQQIYAAPAGE